MDYLEALSILGIPEQTSLEKMLSTARQNTFAEGKETAADFIILHCKQAMNEQNRQARNEQRTRELEVYYL